MQGYIKDYRQELNSDVWLMPPLYHRVWQYLKYMANHADKTIPLADGSKLTIKRGQHLTSIRNICKGVGWQEGAAWKEPSKKTIEKILKWLELNEMIKIDRGKNGRQYTLVTIVNWDLYQSPEDSDSKTSDSGQETKTRNKKSYDPDSTYFKMARYLADKILAWKPDTKIPKDLNGWADEFRKLTEIDKRDKALIKAVIDFATSDSFWQANILSAKKLREKFDTLDAKRRSKTTSQNVTEQPKRNEPDRDPFLEKYERMKQKASDAHDL